MLRSTAAVLPRLTSQLLSCARVSSSSSCALRSSGVLQPHLATHGRLMAPIQHCPSQVITLSNRYCDLSTQKYSVIYKLPHIKLLSSLSRLKLLQTAFTLVILPPVYYLYLQGDLSYFLVSYSTGIAVFAGVMLYTASHFLRRVVGMMYLDSSQTTLKVSHLTFWGKRHDMYMPVSDVMTIGDAGDAVGESILKLKRFSNPQTLYFSLRFGQVVDKRAFEKVFGSLT